MLDLILISTGVSNKIVILYIIPSVYCVSCFLCVSTFSMYIVIKLVSIMVISSYLRLVIHFWLCSSGICLRKFITAAVLNILEDIVSLAETIKAYGTG